MPVDLDEQALVRLAVDDPVAFQELFIAISGASTLVEQFCRVVVRDCPAYDN